METPYDSLIESLRVAAKPERTAPPQMASYLEKVRRHAYRVTDSDVEQLKAAFTEDEIFEQTVATAIAAGLMRLEAAKRALA